MYLHFRIRCHASVSYYMGVEHKDSEFIGNKYINKFPHSLIHIQTLRFIY